MIIGESMMVGKVLVVYQAINSCLDIMTVIPDGHHKPLNALHTYTLFTIHKSEANSFLVQEEPELGAEVVHHSF